MGLSGTGRLYCVVGESDRCQPSWVRRDSALFVLLPLKGQQTDPPATYWGKGGQKKISPWPALDSPALGTAVFMHSMSKPLKQAW